MSTTSHHFSVVTLLLFSSLFNSTTLAVDQIRTKHVVNINDSNLVSTLIQGFAYDSLTETVAILFPSTKQNTKTNPEPQENAPTEAGTDLGTPTPTPIPIQRGSTNLPIVFGALAIVLVVILAWFFVGFLPNRNKE